MGTRSSEHQILRVGGCTEEVLNGSTIACMGMSACPHNTVVITG